MGTEADTCRKDEQSNLLSVNLDVKNPSSADVLEHLPPEPLVQDITAKEQRIWNSWGRFNISWRNANKA